jgi:uncharacterized protein YegL
MSQSNLNLIHDAHNDGDLSQGSLSALTNIGDIGNVLQQGMGMQVQDLQASEVVLINVLLDNSGSMGGEEVAVRTGFDELVKSLIGSKQYMPLTAVPIMDNNHYHIHGGTPLYRETLKLLATVIAKTKEFENNGIQVRTITLIMTDGGDTGEGNIDATDVSTVVTDMLGSEKHIICGMGFGDENYFRTVFSDMGITTNWILTAQSTPSDIRKAFQVFSRSAASASKSAANFAQTNMGGFGTP